MLCLSDYFILNENTIERNLEYKFPENADSKEAWVHRLPGVLPMGCIYHKDHPFFTEYDYTPEQKQEILDHLQEKFQELPPLRGLDEELEIHFVKNFKKPLWKTRRYGDLDEFEEESGFKGHKVVVLSNNQWIGAMNYVGLSCGQFGFLYQGYGFKSGTVNIEQKIQSLNLANKHIMLVPEYPEPNPQNEESEKLETDSEDEDYSV
jgi:hypothetical protein